MQAPWTEIGSLQSDVRDLQSKLHNKVDGYDLRSVQDDVNGLKNRLSELRSSVDSQFSGLRDRLSFLEECRDTERRST